MERHDAPGSTPRLLAMLVRQAGWTEALTDDKRREIVQDCLRDLKECTKQRDRNRLLDIILKLEAADVSRAKLELEASRAHEAADAGTFAAQIMSFIAAARKQDTAEGDVGGTTDG